MLLGKARGRTPQGVRGLKYRLLLIISAALSGRTPQGVRGLKSVHGLAALAYKGRTPQGVRGLKYVPERDGVIRRGRTPQKEGRSLVRLLARG